MTDEILAPGQKAKPTFAMSIDAKMIYERLQKAAVGEKISYEELSAIVQRDIRNGAASPFYSARRRAENLDGIVFGTIVNEGIVRLNDEEIVESGEDLLRRCRRGARRGFKRLTRADYDKLPEPLKVQHNTYASVFNALVAASKPSAVKRIEAKVGEARQTLPLAATLEAFKK
ncbi:MAG: hypothetical protein OEU09_14070 [Rhodospirillales bacterium]|nr:hypothetical protein [Rhodospirillales bacterium]MDH3912415.1 hypothetical protein [Rhodospirillales bacterium]